MTTAPSLGGAVVCLVGVAFTAALAGAGPAGAATKARAGLVRSSAPTVREAAAVQLSHGERNSQMYPGGGIFQFGDALQTLPMSVPASPTLDTPVVAMVAVPGGTTPVTTGGSGGSGGTGDSGGTGGSGGTGSGTSSGTGGAGSSSGTPGAHGFWLASADGEVTPVDSAPNFGSAANLHLYAPIVDLAATPDGHGYWLVALDGEVYTFGDAAFYGSMGGHHLAEPVVGMAATPDGHGYWLVAADGGVFSFGDAAFYGSMGGHHLAEPVVDLAATPDGHGYWLVAADGGVFSFGDAAFYGSLGKKHLQATIAGMAATPQGTGYWLLESNGSVFTFGTAQSFGDPKGSPAAAPFKTIVPTSNGRGYSLLEPDGFDYSFANSAPAGGYRAIVAAAASQIQPDPDRGDFCNPYGACEPWCALFVTWAWQRGGVRIPSYAFVGNIYYWARRHGRVLPPTAHSRPGDAVLFGTGPQSASSAVHAGVVAQVWPDGAIVTIEGDAGPGVSGHLAVVVNGPFVPADATAFANYPVFAVAQP